MERLTIDDRLHLRPLDEADAPALHALIEKNRGYLGRWLAWAPDQTAADTLDFIRRSQAQSRDDDGLQAALVDRGEIVGVAGFPVVDWGNSSSRIGYWLDEAHQGEGKMTKAVRALVDHAVASWELNRIEIRVAVSNSRSRAIPERLGFREEGVLRQAERVGDRHLDTVVYAMLAAEWGAGRTG